MSWDVSFISLHGDPLAELGGPHHGGQNVYVKELSRYLGAFGLTVDVYSRWENEQQPDQEKYSRGTRVIRIPIGPPQEIQKEELIKFLRDIADWIPSYQIQQGLKYNLVHSHYYLSGAIGLHLKNTWGIPLVHTFHSLGVIKEQALGLGDPSPNARVEIEKRLCQSADRIIATNPQERDDLVQLYHTDPEKITIIPCGVNLDLFQPLSQEESKKEIAFSTDDFLITYVGRLENRKGIDTLLEAIHLVDNPSIQLVIVGGTPTDKPFLSWAELSEEPYKKYMAMIDEYGIEKQVTFTGGKSQDQLSRYYSAADITVIPSHYEPFGMTAIEAMACGSSVIASRVGGLKSTVKENKVGALFEPRDASQLAEKIRIVFDQPSMNAEFRKNARPYVEENFSWKSVAKSVTGVYQELILKGQESD
ncbi:MAG: glycosyltransferase [Anaerolineales bacterium]|nr:glycosyltransferase [Anaerolineales bacterium]